ncbi:MAG: hypothetical protein JXA74_09760 [Anaerolineae bacterium]|nr:hypothetical protein [Anaerolineae bacterium]
MSDLKPELASARSGALAAARSGALAAARPALAVQASWEYVRRELEASDPNVARKRAPFLSRLYHAMHRTFAALEAKVAEGRLDPLAQLNTLALGEDPRQADLHPLDRPARVGFFPIGGNPIWWGHLLAGLMAMQALDLDTLIVRIQGEIRYKELPETDRVPVRDRHAIAQDLLARFWPLMRYTDLGREPGNAREGAEEMYRFLALNPETDLHVFYLLGVENRARVERYMAQQYEAAQAHAPAANPGHAITIGWIQRGEYGAQVTQAELDALSRDCRARSGYAGWLASELVQDPHIDLHVSSTYYRNTHDSAIVPRMVHEHALAHGFYGHPPIDPRTGKPYDYTEEEHFRHKLRPIAEGIANQIVRLRERSGDERATLVSLDGPSGSGKTTIAEEVLKYLALRGCEGLHIPFDIFLRDKHWRSGMEKLLLGEPLNSVEAACLGSERARVRPVDAFYDEESFWDTEARAAAVRQLQAFCRCTPSVHRAPAAQLAQGDQEEPVLEILNGYDRATKVRRSYRYALKRGMVILVEGKYCNREELAPCYDLRYRLDDHPDRTKAKFEIRTRTLSPDTADSQMRFYDVGLLPSYARYAERTRACIDWMIDLSTDDWRLVEQERAAPLREDERQAALAPELAEEALAAVLVRA